MVKMNDVTEVKPFLKVPKHIIKWTYYLPPKQEILQF